MKEKKKSSTPYVPSRFDKHPRTQSLARDGIAHAKQRHTEEPEKDAQVAVMVQTQRLGEQLQSHADHDARGNGEHACVGDGAGREVGAVCDAEPEDGDGGAEGLGEPAQDGGPGEGAEARAQGHVQREGHGEALGDVVDEDGHEEAEAEGGAGVVGGVGDEALGELVQGDGDGRLEPEGEEGVGGDVMVVLGLDVTVAFVVDVVVALDPLPVSFLLSLFFLFLHWTCTSWQITRRGAVTGADGHFNGRCCRVGISVADGIGLECPGGRSRQRRRARRMHNPGADVLEALLATGIRIAITDAAFVAVALGVFDEGHDAFLHLGDGRSLRPALGGRLGHDGLRRINMQVASRPGVVVFFGAGGVEEERRGFAQAAVRLAVVVRSPAGDGGPGRMMVMGVVVAEAALSFRISGAVFGFIVCVIAVDYVGGHVTVQEPRNELNADEAANEAAHDNGASRLIGVSGIEKI